MTSTTVDHGCTMDADSGATDHAARSRRGTIAARGFRISELGVLSRRPAPGTTPAAGRARTDSRPALREFALSAGVGHDNFFSARGAPPPLARAAGARGAAGSD